MTQRDQSYTVSVITRTGIGAVHIFATADEAWPAVEQALKRGNARTITVVALDRDEGRPGGGRS